MKYAAVIEYITEQEKVQSVRPTHREYLTKLKDSGQLAASGPFTDGSGALIIYEAETPEQAEQLLRGDPADVTSNGQRATGNGVAPCPLVARCPLSSAGNPPRAGPPPPDPSMMILLYCFHAHEGTAHGPPRGFPRRFG
jgi:uncharacterized protein